MKEPPNERYLEIIADYLVVPVEREERKQRRIMTDNRMATINKRETSLEGLVSQLENGEDGIYNLMNESKTTIFQPKVTITKKDLEEIPDLVQLRDTIERWEALQKTAIGRDAFIIKRAIIEMRKDQYIIKNAYRKPIIPNKLTRSHAPLRLEESYSIDANGNIQPEGFSLCNPTVVTTILCSYSKLKQDAWDDFEGDLWYMMQDFDRVSAQALADYPIFDRIATLKIDGRTNLEIQKDLMDNFDKKYSLEYISSLWRKKIPNLIADQATENLLQWHYTVVEKGKFKKCSRCGQIKLAHNRYFSKNMTSKDGWYSICKCCRNKKKEGS